MLQKIKRLLSFYPRQSQIDSVQFKYRPHESFEVLLKKINAYFYRHPKKRKDFKEELYFLNNELRTFSEDEKLIYAVIPYPFVLGYDCNNVKVFRDEEAGMFYVYLDGKKLYYHKGYRNSMDVQKSFNYIAAEQDVESPHRYLDDFFPVNKGDIVADFGAAEGNFSLLVVDRIRELFILESDAIWMDALHKTFEPWKNKVHIINKFIGDHSDGNTVTMDEIFKENQPDVLKMDIEGAEMKVLENAESFIRQRNIKMAITTYHRDTDADNIKMLLEKNGYKTRFSNKYMLFIYDNLTAPYFRKGLIKACKV